MKYKTILVTVALIICPLANARPNAENAEKAEEKKSEPTATQTTTTPIVSEERSHESLTKPSNKGGFILSASTKITNSKLLNLANSVDINSTKNANPNVTGKAHEEGLVYHNYPGHGEAVPMTLDEYEKEVQSVTERVEIQLKDESSTSQEGISTWILLSGSEPTEKPEPVKIKPKTTKIPITTTTRKRYTTSAKRTRTTTTTESSADPNTLTEKTKPLNRVKAPALKKNDEDTVSTTTKKPKRRTSKVPRTTTTTTTTESASTAAKFEEPTTTYPDDPEESATYLILEAKDDEFNLPSDRDPPKPSKKPKVPISDKKKKVPSKKKKPEEKTDEKPIAEKRPGKPISTQIMNYLSREVMPSVGIGVLGLVVTGALASYFMGGPLGALRRSDDVGHSKDSLYYLDRDEYAGPDGQNEEEMFGKLIAGMPDKSIYQNNIRYRNSFPPPAQYRPNAPPPQLPAQVRIGQQFGNYHVQPYTPQRQPQIKYRNAGYSPMPDPYTAYHQQVQAKANTNTDYHFTQSDGISPIYKSTTEMTSEIQQKSVQLEEEISASGPSGPSAPANEEQHQSDFEALPNPAPYTGSEQYVVGSIIPENINDLITSAPVPEHGPRKRRQSNAIDDDDNEISNEIEDSGTREELTTAKYDLETTPPPQMSIDGTEETASNPSTQNDSSLLEFIRRIFELKIRLGLSFLQNATDAFSKYLNGVQDRVDQAPLFNKPIKK